jgi:predicted transcriptional regulator
MSARKVTQSRGEMLKRLREEHAATVERTRAFFKEQKHVQQEIGKVIREQPKTVLEVAEATGIATHEVLWHLTAMKKYGLVAETGMCGDYPLYQRVVEEK